ncbi:LysM peptidoglycan-binding domain-containing protein [Xylanibacillus composti]|nr:LysM peptidoglycan-binding domain-containing protein [Xylanibacillus composti]
MLLVIGFILFSFMFGTFIQTAFGSEEASRTMDEANFAIQPQTAADAMGLDLAQESNQRHVVVAGDTLWALAQAHAPETMDLRQYVHEIKVLNKMQQSVIYEGQVIWLP